MPTTARPSKRPREAALWLPLRLLVLAAVAAAAAAAAVVVVAEATSPCSSSSSSRAGSGGRGRAGAAAWIATGPLRRHAAWSSSPWLRSAESPHYTSWWLSKRASTTALASGQHRGGSGGGQRRRRGRDGGGGGGKSYKEREREKGRGSSSSSSSSGDPGFPLPLPRARDEEDEASKPEHWPEKVLYGQKLKWPSTMHVGGGGGGEVGSVKEAFRRRVLPGILVRYIDDPAHILRGQYGVYATRDFSPFDIVGEYVGRVVPPAVGGEYVATIDWEDRRFQDGAGQMWGVDSGEYGNEIRMINHFSRIAPVPNCKLVTAYVNELPHILAVVIRPIREGQELLLDYGPNYWCSAHIPPPAEPPGIDDPPEVWGEAAPSAGEEEGDA